MSGRNNQSSNGMLELSKVHSSNQGGSRSEDVRAAATAASRLVGSAMLDECRFAFVRRRKFSTTEVCADFGARATSPYHVISALLIDERTRRGASFGKRVLSRDECK